MDVEQEKDVEWKIHRIDNERAVKMIRDQTLATPRGIGNP